MKLKATDHYKFRLDYFPVSCVLKLSPLEKSPPVSSRGHTNCLRLYHFAYPSSQTSFSVPRPLPLHSSIALRHWQLHSSSFNVSIVLQERQILCDTLCKGSHLFLICNPRLALDLHFRSLQLLRLNIFSTLRLCMHFGSYLLHSPILAVDHLAGLGFVAYPFVRRARGRPPESREWIRGSTVAAFNVCGGPFICFFLRAIAGFTLESFAAVCDL